MPRCSDAPRTGECCALRVYVSSTSIDLQEYRRKAIDLVLRHGHHPIAMEYYVAEDLPPLDKCLQDVASCNLYVGIFAWRYGFMPAGCSASITEFEYRKAREKRIPVIAFLLDESAPWPDQYRDTGDQGERLRALRAELQTGKLVSFFSDPDEFQAKLGPAIAQYAGYTGQPIVGAIPDVRAFRDREEQREDIRGALRDDEARLVCIVGRGGVGKTWLLAKIAREVEKGDLCLAEAARLLGADGLIYVRCDETGQPLLEHIFQCVGRMLGSPHDEQLREVWMDASRSRMDKIADLLARLRSGCYVLCLDRFESFLGPDDMIVDPDLRSFVEACISGDPCLRLLTTSRRGLVLPPSLEGALGAGRRDVAVSEGLPDADAVALLREMGADPRFQAASDEELLALARRCACLPSVLATLVGLVRQNPTWSLPDLLADDDLLSRLPENPARELYAGLAPDEQAVFRALAVYDHPVDVAAIRRLLPQIGDAVEEVVNRLARSHLLVQEGGGFWLSRPDQEYAYGQVPEVRSFAQRVPWARGQPVTRTDLHTRAAEHWALSGKLRAEWKTREDLTSAFQHFRQLTKAGQYDGAYRVLESFAFSHLWVWGHVEEVIQLCEGLRGRLTNPDFRHLHLGNLGLAYWSLGRPLEALQLHREALQMATERGQTPAISAWRGNVAVDQFTLGDLDAARQGLEQALANDRESGDLRLQVVHLSDLGEVLRIQGDLAGCRRLAEEGLGLVGQTREERVESNLLDNLGESARLSGAVEKADCYFRRGLASATACASAAGRFANLCGLARCSLFRGDYVAALAASQTAHEVDHSRSRNVAAFLLGLSYAGAGTAEAAAPLFQEAHERSEALLAWADRNWEAGYCRAAALLARGRGQEALGAYRDALAACSGQGAVLVALADLHLARTTLGDLPGAAEADSLLRQAAGVP